jgi:hypothetical protein
MKRVTRIDKTHIIIAVTLPRRYDPFLELATVVDCSGEQLLDGWNRPPQTSIFHIQRLRKRIHSHS